MCHWFELRVTSTHTHTHKQPARMHERCVGTIFFIPSGFDFLIRDRVEKGSDEKKGYFCNKRSHSADAHVAWSCDYN